MKLKQISKWNKRTIHASDPTDVQINDPLCRIASQNIRLNDISTLTYTHKHTHTNTHTQTHTHKHKHTNTHIYTHTLTQTQNILYFLFH